MPESHKSHNVYPRSAPTICSEAHALAMPGAYGPWRAHPMVPTAEAQQAQAAPSKAQQQAQTAPSKAPTCDAARTSAASWTSSEAPSAFCKITASAGQAASLARASVSTCNRGEHL